MKRWVLSRHFVLRSDKGTSYIKAWSQMTSTKTLTVEIQYLSATLCIVVLISISIHIHTIVQYPYQFNSVFSIYSNCFVGVLPVLPLYSTALVTDSLTQSQTASVQEKRKAKSVCWWLGWTTALQIPYNVVYTTLYIQRTTTDHVVSAIDVEAPDPRNAIVRYIKC